MRPAFGLILIGLLLSPVSTPARQATDHTAFETRSARATGTTDPMASGVLVEDGGPRTSTPGWPRGLWHLTPSGVLTKLVGRKWRAHAWNPISGVVVSPRRFAEGQPFDYAVLFEDEATPLKPRAGRLSCASWSSDGEVLAYLTGDPHYYANPAWGVAGTLWVAHRDSLQQPVAVAKGLFPECPAWSPADRSLAYLIQGGDERSWEMRVLDGYRTEVLKEFNIRAPSVSGPYMNRTFDFSSSGDLFFLARRSIYVNSEQSVTTFGPAAVLDEMRDDEADGWLRYVRSLRVSPDGLMVAVTANWDKTGVVDSDSLMRVAPNRFRAWSGNFGIVTFGLNNSGQLAVALFPVDPQGDARELPRSALKQLIHADLGGQWFAHSDSRGRGRVFWYNPDGSRLQVTELDFNARAHAVTAGGIIDLTIWP